MQRKNTMSNLQRNIFPLLTCEVFALLLVSTMLLIYFTHQITQQINFDPFRHYFKYVGKVILTKKRTNMEERQE